MSDEMAVATDQAMQDSSLNVGEQPAEQTTFLDVDLGDEKLSFTSPDEATNWIKEGALRQRDYTKKTQTLAQERQQFQQEQAERQKKWEAEQAEFQKTREKYDGYEAAFARRPHIRKQLEKLASQPARPDEIFERSQGYVDEKYAALEQRLQSFEEAREREQLNQQRDATYQKLRERYGDRFSDEKVNAMLNTLEEGNLEPLLELALKASLYDPEGSERSVLEKLERKQGARIAPAGGGNASPATNPTRDLDASYEQALEEYAGITGA